MVADQQGQAEIRCVGPRGLSSAKGTESIWAGMLLFVSDSYSRFGHCLIDGSNPEVSPNAGATDWQRNFIR